MERFELVEVTCKALYKDRPLLTLEAQTIFVNWVFGLVENNLYVLWDTSRLVEKLCQAYPQVVELKEFLLREGFNGKALETATCTSDWTSFPMITPEIKTLMTMWAEKLLTFPIGEPSFMNIKTISQKLAENANKHDMEAALLWSILDTDTKPPFVDRHKSILETIRCISNLNSKPTYPILSTSMGMGKTTFLTQFVKQFLQRPSLMYEYLFETQSPHNITTDSISSIIEEKNDSEIFKRASFINALNRAVKSGYLIDYEPTNQRADDPTETLENALTNHIENCFLGTFMKTEKHKTPTIITSIDDLKFVGKISAKLKRFCELVEINMVEIPDIFNTTSTKHNWKTPLIFLIDSFHLIERNRDKEGSLHQICSFVATLKKAIPEVSMVIASNSLPNQFTSQENTLYYLHSINLELLLGGSVFKEIALDLWKVHLNSSVLEEEFGIEDKTDTKIELSPFLTRLIISILYICSGNGRAIERVFSGCKSLLDREVATELELDYDTRMKHKFSFHNIMKTCRTQLSNFINQYYECTTNELSNEKLFNLIKILGVNVPISYSFPGNNYY